MKRNFKKLAAVMLAAAMCTGSTLYVQADSQVITPNQENSVESAYGDYSYTETELTLDYNGLKLAATLTMPDVEEGTEVPMAILCHGYTGSQNHYTSYAQVYGTNGIGSIRFDFPANGKSEGESTEISALTEKEVVNFILDYVEEMDGVDKDQIYLCGQSMGGLVATLCGAERQDEIQGLILCYPAYTSGDAARNGNMLGAEFAPENIPDTLDVYGYTVGSVFIKDAMSIDVYGEILPTLEKDVLIFHGTNDDMVDVSASEKAVEILPSAKLVEIEGAGHGFPGYVLADIMPISVEFIKDHQA